MRRLVTAEVHAFGGCLPHRRGPRRHRPPSRSQVYGPGPGGFKSLLVLPRRGPHRSAPRRAARCVSTRFDFENPTEVRMSKGWREVAKLGSTGARYPHVLADPHGG